MIVIEYDGKGRYTLQNHPMGGGWKLVTKSGVHIPRHATKIFHVDDKADLAASVRRHKGKHKALALVDFTVPNLQFAWFGCSLKLRSLVRETYLPLEDIGTFDKSIWRT